MRLLREPDTFEVVPESGHRYQLEVQAFWDDRKDNDLRVSIAIDDGGRSAYHPLVIDFIVASDGSFVGE